MRWFGEWHPVFNVRHRKKRFPLVEAEIPPTTAVIQQRRSGKSPKSSVAFVFRAKWAHKGDLVTKFCEPDGGWEATRRGDTHQPQQRFGMRLRNADSGNGVVQHMRCEQTLNETRAAKRVHVLDGSTSGSAPENPDAPANEHVGDPIAGCAPVQRAVDSDCREYRGYGNRGEHLFNGVGCAASDPCCSHRDAGFRRGLCDAPAELS